MMKLLIVPAQVSNYNSVMFNIMFLPVSKLNMYIVNV